MQEATQAEQAKGRDAIAAWQAAITQNCYTLDTGYQDTVRRYLHPDALSALDAFGQVVPSQLEALVARNNLRLNLPTLEHYDGIGRRIDLVTHHPDYLAAGDLIYGTRILQRLRQPGGLLESLAFFFLSAQVGEGGHNCPFACTAGIIRTLQKVDNIPMRDHYLDKLTYPAFTGSYTGAQFLTEVQGGSDVGKNACIAVEKAGQWFISGEKWFCSNANADLILMTARYDQTKSGTQGLGLFLVPTRQADGQRHGFFIRRLKEKLGTRSMASGEVDFVNCLAYPMGPLEKSFKLMMTDVLHLSRLCNSVCVLGMARRAFFIAKTYAMHREAFGHTIIHYPLVQENLARIYAENTAMLAGVFATLHQQDQWDLGQDKDPSTPYLLRLLANLNKYITAKWSVEHIHHALDVLAGNGAIETFSPIPRLFRDSIVCENWEGTHNTLFMQTLRDLLKYKVDQFFLNHLTLAREKIEDSRAAMLANAQRQLAEQFTQFNTLAPKAQALMIRPLVDEMCRLFMATHLLQEAQTCRQKALSFDYFAHCHFPEGKLSVTQTLALIEEVLLR